MPFQLLDQPNIGCYRHRRSHIMFLISDWCLPEQRKLFSNLFQHFLSNHNDVLFPQPNQIVKRVLKMQDSIVRAFSKQIHFDKMFTKTKKIYRIQKRFVDRTLITFQIKDLSCTVQCWGYFIQCFDILHE